MYAYIKEPTLEAFWCTLIIDHDMIQRPASSNLALTVLTRRCFNSIVNRNILSYEVACFPKSSIRA